MITNYSVPFIDERIRVLRLMKESPFYFCLTGSRFFDRSISIEAATDFDFYVGEWDTQGVRKWLAENGFTKKIGTSTYQIQDCNAVYRHNSVSIDIQLINCVDEKDSVQQRLFSKYGKEFNLFSKERRIALWQKEYEAFWKEERDYRDSTNSF